jgi:hypothetical protein
VLKRENYTVWFRLPSERVSDQPSSTSEEYGRERTREPAPLFDSHRNKHRRHHYIRERQNHHPDPLNQRSTTRALPKEFVNGTATSKNIRPQDIFLAIFDRFDV